MSNAKPSSLTRQLLTDLQGYFTHQQAKHSPTEQLLDYLAAIDNAPWATFVQGKAITARHLARLLQPYGIAPKNIRIGKTVPKCYRAADFDTAFADVVADNVADKVADNAKNPVADNPVADVVADNVADVVADNVADNVVAAAMADQMRAERARLRAKPPSKWPPPKGWAWNHKNSCYEPPKPTVQADPPDQALIGQTLRVSPNLKYRPGYGLVAVACSTPSPPEF